MAVILVEGFDAYNGAGNTSTAVGLTSRWSLSSTAFLNVSSTTPYDVGQSLSVTYGTINTKAASIALSSNNSAGCIGFNFKLSTVPTGTVTLVQLLFNSASSGQRQLAFMCSSDGRLLVGNGTLSDPTAIYTSSSTLNPLSWNYVEFEFTISNASGSVNMYVNGALFDSASGLDTQSQSGSDYNTLVIGGFNSTGQGATAYIDDLYLTDTASYLGPQRVLTTYVDADSAPSDWSASTPGADPYTMLDEVLCDGDTTYIYSGTAGESAVFSTQNPSITLTSVEAVQIGGFARKTDTGVRGIQLQYVNGGGSTYNSSESILGTGYSRPVNLLATNPGTGLAWTAAELNAMRIGVRIST